MKKKHQFLAVAFNQKIHKFSFYIFVTCMVVYEGNE